MDFSSPGNASSFQGKDAALPLSAVFRIDGNGSAAVSKAGILFVMHKCSFQKRASLKGGGTNEDIMIQSITADNASVHTCHVSTLCLK